MILLASGTPHLPQVYGGVEVNTHELALELNQRDCPAAVLSKLSPRDTFGALRHLQSVVFRQPVVSDDSLGYRTYRARLPWNHIGAIPRARAAIVQNGNMVALGQAFADLGIPAIAYLHGLEFETGQRGWENSIEKLPFRAYIANSKFTAERFKSRFSGNATVIPPVFRAERYRAMGERTHVTFINPVQEKGVDLAIEIAALCADIPFCFVKGWPLGRKGEQNLKMRLANLGNVTLVDRRSDMRSVYGATRVLLVPSQWQAETWGRVASEAQFSGIPVLASARGGLPEAVGGGGTILPHDADAAIWAAELRALWDDANYYAVKSQAALQHAARSDIDINHQIELFMSLVKTVC